MIVGIFSTAVDFLIMALILYADGKEDYGSLWNVIAHSAMHKTPVSIYLTANFCGIIAGIAVNYILCVFFVYTYGHIGKTKKGFLKFCLFSLIGVVINTFLSFLGFSLLKLNAWIVKIIVTLLVFVYNFFTRKYFIFNIKLIIDDDNTIEL